MLTLMEHQKLFRIFGVPTIFYLTVLTCLDLNKTEFVVLVCISVVEMIDDFKLSET